MHVTESNREFSLVLATVVTTLVAVIRGRGDGELGLDGRGGEWEVRWVGEEEGDI